MRRRVALKPKRKASAQKRKRGELIQCWSCPRDHGGWKRSKLRSRKRTLYCPEHLAEYDGKHRPWPKCPECGSDEFGYMDWNGSVKKAEAYCQMCSFTDKALNHFDAVTIQVLAGPIQERDHV